MAIGKSGAANAALFAAAILALKYPATHERLSAFRAKRRKEALDNQIP
jgi:5-(carboxyamino)imidazole ribonucleotide mutase